MPRKQNTSGDNYYSALPTRLRTLLTDRNITQQELADYIGKSRQIISRYADGSSAPDWQTIVKISAFFGVSSDYLLGITDIPTANTELRSVCDYTGLSEKAVEFIRHLPEADKDAVECLVEFAKR